MNLNSLISALGSRGTAPALLRNLAGQLSAGADSSPQAPQRDLLLLRAMIAAAHADGPLDQQELVAIRQRADQLELDAADRALLLCELAEPWRIGQLAARVNGENAALAVYLASARAIDPGCQGGRQYLANLAEALALSPQVMRALDAGRATQPSAAA